MPTGRPPFEDSEGELMLEKRMLRAGGKPELAINPVQLRMQHVNGALHFATSRMLLHDAHFGVSKVPLKKLRLTTLDKLILEMRKEGKYLTLRTLEPPQYDDGITTVVTDQNGNVVLFTIFNFKELAVEKSPRLLLPSGTIFILKEPFIMTFRHNCIVISDCPSDMIIVSEGHDLFGIVKDIAWPIASSFNYDPVIESPMPRTAAEWQMRGDELFALKKYEHSVRCHSMAVKELEQTMKAMHQRMSTSYFHRGYYEKSLEFSTKVLAVDPINRSALVDAARCYYQLRKYVDARVHFKKYREVSVTEDGTAMFTKKIEDEMTEAYNRMTEQQQGIFPMFKLFTERVTNCGKVLDHADYTGPIDRIKTGLNKYCLVARTAIEPGTLLAASKALAYATTSEDRMDWLLNPDPLKVRKTEGWRNLVVQLAKKIQKNPNTYGKVIYELNDGRERTEDAPTSAFCAPTNSEEVIIDWKRLEDIVKFNVTVDNVDYHRVKQVFQRGGAFNLGFGVFAKPSYFKHSCLPNASVYIFNNMMFVRAIQHIKAQEVVSIPYVSWKAPYDLRERVCNKLGFQCECKLCQYERGLSEGEQTKRKCTMERYVHCYNNLTKETNRFDKIKKLKADIVGLIDELGENVEGSKELHEIITTGLMYTLLTLAFSIECGQSGGWDPNEERKVLHLTLKTFGFDSIKMLDSPVNMKHLLPRNAFLEDSILLVISRLIFVESYGTQTTIKKERKEKWMKIFAILEGVHSGGESSVVLFKYPRSSGFIQSHKL